MRAPLVPVDPAGDRDADERTGDEGEWYCGANALGAETTGELDLRGSNPQLPLTRPVAGCSDINTGCYGLDERVGQLDPLVLSVFEELVEALGLPALDGEWALVLVQAPADRVVGGVKVLKTWQAGSGIVEAVKSRQHSCGGRPGTWLLHQTLPDEADHGGSKPPKMEIALAVLPSKCGLVAFGVLERP